MNISTKSYKYQIWNEKFPKLKVNLKKLPYHRSWDSFFKKEFDKPYFGDIEENLTYCLEKTKGNINIYPYPDLVFESFTLTPYDKIKVVILGQDPYHGSMHFGGKRIPQAMGLSFSVPNGHKVPSSLQNIFKNLIKYGHMNFLPQNGNLSFWALQGCLMINTALTVQDGHANSHKDYWTTFSDGLIKYLSEEKDGLVFMLWGGNSLKKLPLIDQKKHKVLISSHPSGLSVNNYLGKHKPFSVSDLFGQANEYLRLKDRMPIIWQLGFTTPT